MSLHRGQTIDRNGVDVRRLTSGSEAEPVPVARGASYHTSSPSNARRPDSGVTACVGVQWSCTQSTVCNESVPYRLPEAHSGELILREFRAIMQANRHQVGTATDFVEDNLRHE